MNRNTAIYALNTATQIDMYRWAYERGITDVPTLCEEGYSLYNYKCISKQIIMILRKCRISLVL